MARGKYEKMLTSNVTLYLCYIREDINSTYEDAVNINIHQPLNESVLCLIKYANVVGTQPYYSTHAKYRALLYYKVTGILEKMEKSFLK
jgi:hypothetical protein